jgi:glycosyltransferase involved in cell wall biosynthesis
MPLYVYRLAQYLPETRPEYRFVLFVNRGFEHNEAPEIYQERIQNLSLLPNVKIVNANDDGEMHWEQSLLPSLLRENRVDLLHMPGNRICYRAAVPQVATIHDVMEYRFLKQIVAIPPSAPARVRLWIWRKRAYVWLNYKVAIKRASRIITVSSASAGEITRTCGIPKDRIEVILHGIDPEFIPEKKHDPNPELREHCLMLGGDSYQKNPETGIQAWADLPLALRKRFPLVIVGFVPHPGSALSSAIQKYGVADQVTIRGWLSQSELISHFQRAALFIYPSRCEGFGFPILQAMACGTPAVCSRIPSLEEVAGRAACTSEPENAGGFSEHIRALLTNNELWQEYRNLGLTRSAQFHWRHCAEEHARVYESLLRPVIRIPQTAAAVA